MPSDVTPDEAKERVCIALRAWLDNPESGSKFTAVRQLAQLPDGRRMQQVVLFVETPVMNARIEEPSPLIVPAHGPLHVVP